MGVSSGGTVGGGGSSVAVGGGGSSVAVGAGTGVSVGGSCTTEVEVIVATIIAVFVGGGLVAVFVGGGLVGVALGMMIAPPPDEVRVGKTAINVLVGVRLGVAVWVAVAPVIGIEITSASVEVGAGVSGRTGVAVSVKNRSANAC